MVQSRRIQEEISKYSNQEHVHHLPPIHDYWTEKFLLPKFKALGFNDRQDFYLQYIERVVAQYPAETCRVLSLGAGNCDIEVALAQSLREKNIHNIQFVCVEINPHMLARGRQLLEQTRLSEQFRLLEVNIGDLSFRDKYHVVIANHSLHHIVELEAVFDGINRTLVDNGFFLTDDMIGRNGHMRWPESLEIVLGLWSTLDDRYKLNHAKQEYEPILENWDSSSEGFEGIRAQDILPLLISKFHFDFFLGFKNLISVFVDYNFGPNFEPDNPKDRNFIDTVARMDEYFIEVGKLKPTQMIAALVKHPVKNPRFYKHLTPEFCVRPTDLKQNLIYITDPNPYAIKLDLITKMRRRGFHKFIPKWFRIRARRLLGKW